MKKLSIIILSITLLVSCSKDPITPNNPTIPTCPFPGALSNEVYVNGVKHDSVVMKSYMTDRTNRLNEITCFIRGKKGNVLIALNYNAETKEFTSSFISKTDENNVYKGYSVRDFDSNGSFHSLIIDSTCNSKIISINGYCNLKPYDATEPYFDLKIKASNTK